MIGAGNQQVARGLQAAGVDGVKVGEAVHVFEIEGQSSAGAVDFERIAIAISDSVTGGLKSANASVGETGEQEDSVINISSCGEGMRHCDQTAERTVQIQSCIERVREQIAGRTGAGFAAPVAPTGRFGRIVAGLVEIERTVMIGLANPAFVNHALSESHGWDSAIVEPDESRNSRSRFRHALRLWQ